MTICACIERDCHVFSKRVRFGFNGSLKRIGNFRWINDFKNEFSIVVPFSKLESFTHESVQK